MDRRGIGAPGPDAERELLRRVERSAEGVDGFIILPVAPTRGTGCPIPRASPPPTPNLEETAEATGMSVEGETDIERVGSKLRGTLGAEALLVTRGADDRSLFEPEADRVHIPVANKSEVFDVTGAGDTVVAAFTCARLRGR